MALQGGPGQRGAVGLPAVRRVCVRVEAGVLQMRRPALGWCGISLTPAGFEHYVYGRGGGSAAPASVIRRHRWRRRARWSRTAAARRRGTRTWRRELEHALMGGGRLENHV